MNLACWVFVALSAVLGQVDETNPTAPAKWKPADFVLADNDTQEQRWTGEKISLSLRDADLVEVLRSFAKLSGLNLVLDPEVHGSVTVELHEVPWDQALAVILKTHRLALEIDGNLWTAARPASRDPH